MIDTEELAEGQFVVVFGEVEIGDKICPHCGREFADWDCAGCGYEWTA